MIDSIALITSHAVLAVAWLVYFVLHSVLASHLMKSWTATHFPRANGYYRLFYNAAAVVFLLPPLWLSYHLTALPLWHWTGVAHWLADGLALAAVGGFIWSLRFYSSQDFLGLNVLRSNVPARVSTLRISPLHRYVRHPWYALALVIVWTRSMDTASLVTALMVTGYFVVGSYFEENKLVEEYGEAYQSFQRQVPRLLPWPGRVLSREVAREIEESAARQRFPVQRRG